MSDTSTVLLIVSHVVIVAVGAAVCILSIWGIASPRSLIRLVSSVVDHSAGVAVAVAVRLLLGAALITYAPHSPVPVAFQVLGWMAIIAAVVLLIAGRALMRRLVAWAARLPVAMTRVWLVFGLAFGAFLIYGATL